MLNMEFLQILSLFYLFIIPIFAQDLESRLNELGFDFFSEFLAVNNPDLVARIARSHDITVWAPPNDRVAAFLSALAKRDDSDGKNGTMGKVMVTTVPPPPQDDSYPFKRKRQAGEGPPAFPDTNFETIFTFLNSSELVNLGQGQVARFVKNQAAPLDGGATSLSPLEVTSGLGQTQHTLQGPFKFANGVIYEVSDFFTLPQPFTQTFQQLNLAPKFYKKVVSTGNLPLFEDTPAVTIFAPIDSYVTQPDNSSSYNSDAQSHIITGKLAIWFSPQLIPGRTLFAKSGAPIKISFAQSGERLVNCRRLLKANVVTKNGVVHFIDGPLYGSEGCDAQSKTSPPGNSTGTERPPMVTAVGASSSLLIAPGLGLLATAFAAGLLAFHMY